MNVEIPDQKLHCFMFRRPWPMLSEWKWSTWPAVGSRFSSFYLPLLSFALSRKFVSMFSSLLVHFRQVSSSFNPVNHRRRRQWQEPIATRFKHAKGWWDDDACSRAWNGELMAAWQRMRELWNIFSRVFTCCQATNQTLFPAVKRNKQVRRVYGLTSDWLCD